MAYGRDAQAEEILLDALKVDASRAAIALKLLEIYAHRNNAAQFETVASDLYARTGGEGPDWLKAAEMGRRLDPDNPLYGAASEPARGTTKDLAARRAEAPGSGVPSVAAAGLAALGAVAAPHGVAGSDGQQGRAGNVADTSSGLAFDPYSGAAADLALAAPELGGPDFAADGNRGMPAAEPATLSMTADLAGAGPFADLQPTSEAMIDALPEVDSSALDFDLDAGLGLDVELPTLEAAPAGVPHGEASVGDRARPDELELDLDLAEEPAPAPAEADFMSATIVGDTIDLAMPSDHGEFDLNPEADKPLPPAGLSELDLAATAVLAELPLAASGTGETDIEKTTFDSSILDFDFNLDEPEPSAAVPVPTFDLSSINLDLDLASPDAVAPPEPLMPASEFSLDAADGLPALDDEALQEVDTKLELARAYDDMGDKEGARELIEEVLREGSSGQQAAARRLMERLA
jgi:pilus assembly protein FimV